MLKPPTKKVKRSKTSAQTHRDYMDMKRSNEASEKVQYVVDRFTHKHTAGATVIHDLIIGLEAAQTPAEHVYQSSFHLCKLLILQALSRCSKNLKAGTNLGDCLFMLTPEEIDVYTKLAKSVLAANNSLINQRKQEFAERLADDKNAELALPVYNSAELETLMALAKIEQKD